MKDNEQRIVDALCLDAFLLVIQIVVFKIETIFKEDFNSKKVFIKTIKKIEFSDIKKEKYILYREK